MAHEINNPLAYVIANVQYALDAINQRQMRESDPSADPDRRRAQIKEAFYEANEGARRAQRIITLDSSRRWRAKEKTGSRAQRREEHAGLGHRCESMPEIRLHARLVRDFDPMPMVRGDEARLGQVFVNILLNAAQAILAGHPQDHEIRICAGTRNGRVLVEALDTGPGIRDEHLRRTLDPFFTTKPRGIGTGPGLSICHEIVASMRGSLTAENRPRGGAKFVVELPAHIGTADPPSAPRSRPPSSASPGQRASLSSTTKRWRPRPWRQSCAITPSRSQTTPPRASSSALENRFDVIFCDLMMPDLTGMAVHEAVSRQCPEIANSMIFVTGGTFTDEARTFAARHATRCLFKPFDTALVRNAIAHLLEEQGAASRQSVLAMPCFAGSIRTQATIVPDGRCISRLARGYQRFGSGPAPSDGASRAEQRASTVIIGGGMAEPGERLAAGRARRAGHPGTGRGTLARHPRQRSQRGHLPPARGEHRSRLAGSALAGAARCTARHVLAIGPGDLLASAESDGLDELRFSARRLDVFHERWGAPQLHARMPLLREGPLPMPSSSPGWRRWTSTRS